MKKWVVLSSDAESVRNIIKSTDLAPLTAEVMSARGYNDIDSLKSFFDLEPLSDPYLLTDMSKAVTVINEAIENGETICVYGDYDCDGVTSTAILYDYLLNMGAEVICYIPERSEGYGLNKAAIDTINENGASLIITVDNGISAIEEAKYIKELGMKLVVTDHHQPSDELPEAEAVIDPYRKNCTSPFRHLAGVGVTLKLLAALDDGDYSLVCEQYGDIAAIGTIADVVPLVSENRTIVSNGLRMIRNTENYGLISLMEESGVDPENITSTNVAFTLSPRINAAGRFGSPITALDMLTSEEDKARGFAHELSVLNERRKKAEADICDEIRQLLKTSPQILNERVLVVSGDGWHHGVIGIVAARLLEAYEKPVVVISKDDDGFAVGSARSMKGFNIFKCFESCRDILVKFGGHECAGGLTVKCEDIPKLNNMIQSYAKESCPKMPRFTITADKLIKGTDITIKNISDLKRLEPFGTDNASPVFAFSAAKVLAVMPLKNGEHTRLDIDYDGVKLKALLFRKKTALMDISAGDTIDIMGSLEINSFRGTESISLIVSDYRLHGVRQEKYFAACDAYESFLREEQLPAEYYEKALPSREELIEVYKYIGAQRYILTAETLYARLGARGMNAFKLFVCLDIFKETGLIAVEGYKKRIQLLKPSARVDIMTAPTMIKLKNLIG